MVFRIKDINPGFSSSNPVHFTAIGNRVYFAAAGSDAAGPELWISEGTEASTRLVADLNPFAGSSPGNASRAVFGGLYFFSAYDGSSTTLFRSDGLVATPIGSRANIGSLVATADNLYYYSPTGASNLWYLDTPLGLPSPIVKPGGVGPFNPLYMTAVGPGNDLFFVDGNEIWRTNGVVSSQVVMPATAPTPRPLSPRNLVAVGSTLFFSGTDSAGGYSLWTYDSTRPLPPVWLRSFLSFAGEPLGGVTPPQMVAVGSRLFFSATGADGIELWVTDGTPAGTVQVSNIAAAPGADSRPGLLTAVDSSTLFFVATDGTSGRELWRSNGTAAGTRRVIDINLTGDSQPLDLTVVGSRLYFTADDGVNGRQLWSTDLVTNTTRRLTSRTMWGAESNFYVAVNDSGTTRNLTVAGNTLFFSANRRLPGDPSSGPAFEGFELWGLDLTEANRPAPLEIIVVNTTTLPSPRVSLLVRFSEPIWVDPAARSQFTIRIGGVVRSVTSIAPGLLNHELVINLAGPSLASGDVAVRVTYTDPSSGDDAAGVIEDLAGNDLASFDRLAETFSNDANVTVLHPSYTNLILRGSARLGTANANANRITVEQNPAVTNVLVGSDLVDTMDGAGGRDIYLVTDPAHHTGGEINDSGTDGRDELRFASTSASEQTLVVYGSDQGLEDVVIGVGTGDTAIVTGTTPKNIDANAVANGLRITGNNGANTIQGTSFRDQLTGNDGNDNLLGGAGMDTLIGGNGNDRLRGGIGADVFFFNASLVAGNRDIIEDFNASDDKLFLSRTIFTAFMPPLLGALQPSAFRVGAAPTTAEHRIIYNNITGSLSYDSDGIGGTATSPAFAILDLVGGVRPALTASNIMTVA